MAFEQQHSPPLRGGESLLQRFRDKTVPIHRHTIWYYFGGMTLFLFAVQVVSGILLLLYYRPTAESAFESVQFIMAEVSFGWLIRSIHSWSANLMILTLFIHMASVYLTRAYRRPREATWISGVGLLVVVLGFGFSGYLLPWNKLAFFATQVGTQIVGSVPIVGSFLLRFLRGGESVTGATITRFYAFHVAILPATATALLALHLLLVQLHGMSASTLQEAAPDELFKSDIHNQLGITCGDCHKDNPQPEKREVAALCARCHSDLNYMRRFNPQMRVDQFAEYQTSVHGMRNARGDENVATCTSCHSVHDIRRVRDPRSPVYPTQIASTCATCHSDTKRMGAYRIPANQFEKYRKSVHATALLDGHDLAAPSCNNCHGNHGARPPGVDSVASVCGQCHRQEKDLFGKSPHAQPFQDLGLAGCVVCHENHEIRKTDDRMLSTEGIGVCSDYHSDDASVMKIRSMQYSILNLRLDIDTASETLERAERAGMEISKTKFNLEQAHAELVKARVSVHAFSPEKIAELTNPAMTMTAAAHKSANRALEEVGIRRRGLGYALIAIAVTIVGLILKIREIERR